MMKRTCILIFAVLVCGISAANASGAGTDSNTDIGLDRDREFDSSIKTPDTTDTKAKNHSAQNQNAPTGATDIGGPTDDKNSDKKHKHCKQSGGN